MKLWMEKAKAALLAMGLPGLFLIGFVDGVGLPNPSGPDVLLVLFAIASPGMAYWGAALTVLGSLAGSIILYSVARRGGEFYLDRHAPGARGVRIRDWFRHYGLMTVFVPALIPIPMPLKLFVMASGVFQVPRKSFLATMAAARLPRYLAMAWLGVSLRDDAFGWLSAHKWHMLAVAGLMFGALFLTIHIGEKRRLASREPLAPR